MILNIMLAYSRDKIKPAFSDPLLMLSWVVIEPIPGGFMRIPPQKKHVGKEILEKKLTERGRSPRYYSLKGGSSGDVPKLTQREVSDNK
jgi:hypothetical protein